MLTHAHRMPRAQAIALAALVGLTGVGGCATRRVIEDVATGVTAPPDPAAGHRIFEQACVSCHGTDAHGDGLEASELGAKPADLTQLSATHGGSFPKQLVIDTLAGQAPGAAHEGHRPPWGVRQSPRGSGASTVASAYQQRRLRQLVAYLESIQRDDQP